MAQATRQIRIPAVDALKGLAIIAVLLLHSLPRQLLFDSYAVFHIWQAVPVLIILMGYTGTITRVRPIGEYARRRAIRLLMPLGIAWLVSLAIALLQGEFSWTPLLLVGVLPSSGPGNYFITLVLEFALILPVLRWLLDRGIWTLVGTCLAIDVTYQLLAGQLGWEGYLHSSSVLRVLFAISLGMLLASGRHAWPLFPVSLGFLFSQSRGIQIPLFVETWQSQSFLAAGYPATLVELGLRGTYPRWLSIIGRGSYHIFLVQILWFGSVARYTVNRLALSIPGNVLLDVLCCLAIGLMFWVVEGQITRIVFGLRQPR